MTSHQHLHEVLHTRRFSLLRWKRMARSPATASAGVPLLLSYSTGSSPSSSAVCVMRQMRAVSGMLHEHMHCVGANQAHFWIYILASMSSCPATGNQAHLLVGSTGDEVRALMKVDLPVHAKKNLGY